MSSTKKKRNFFDLFKTERPVLNVKLSVSSDEIPTEIHIENTLGDKIDINDLIELGRICTDERLKDFVDFYSNYDGFNLATPTAPQNAVNRTLLRQLPASDIFEFTNQYLSGGKWAWTIDLNKTKAIYRSESKWLAFAVVGGGPACLTIFLDGENAGSVFLLRPQPHFNILKPVARSYNQFLDRIAKDPAAFLKLIRAYVTIVGKDKQNYGHVPIEYIDSK